MYVRSIQKALLIFVLSMFAVTAQAKGSFQNDPVELLQYIADNMLSNLKDNKATLKSKPDIVYSLAYKYVVPYADLAEMSKRVLSPTVWKNATPAQRKQFQKEFTVTVIRTYTSALTSYQDQAVEFFPIRGGVGNLKTVEVNSQIRGARMQPIHVTYRLLRTGSIWRLYDMSVEGVDMIESFRAQFADIISQGSMDKLLDRLAGHNNR